VVNYTAYPLRSDELVLLLPASEAIGDLVGTVRAALSAVPTVSQDPAPRIALEEITDKGIRLSVRYWTPDIENTRPEAIAVLRARFPRAEVRGA
jgi:small-conductance mechanosensitive channel